MLTCLEMSKVRVKGQSDSFERTLSGFPNNLLGSVNENDFSFAVPRRTASTRCRPLEPIRHYLFRFYLRRSILSKALDHSLYTSIIHYRWLIYHRYPSQNSATIQKYRESRVKRKMVYKYRKTINEMEEQWQRALYLVLGLLVLRTGLNMEHPKRKQV